MITSRGTDCRMLVVDDSPDIAILVRAYAAELPIDLVIAETAEAGLRKFRESRFAVVLMDYHLPDRNGAEVVRDLRRWERQLRQAATAVFALSDLRDFKTGEEMLMAGCTALAGKPLSRHQFLTIAGCRRGGDSRWQSRTSAMPAMLQELAC